MIKNIAVIVWVIDSVSLRDRIYQWIWWRRPMHLKEKLNKGNTLLNTDSREVHCLSEWMNIISSRKLGTQPYLLQTVMIDYLYCSALLWKIISVLSYLSVTANFFTSFMQFLILLCFICQSWILVNMQLQVPGIMYKYLKNHVWLS